VLGVNEQDGVIIVSARTATNRNSANITMVFSAPNIELRQWTVRDNQGGTTTVALQNPQTGAALDAVLFDALAQSPTVKQSAN
jgi:outer membrane lipoprotein-sorting protein